MHKVLFGDIVVSENTEHQVFLYKLLVVLMVTGAVFTASLVFGSWLQINPIDGPHLHSMQLFTVLVTVLWLSLRGRQRYFIGVAWLYEIICLLEYLSALLFVPQDELRILWFYLNIPGVYIILGKQAGRFITLITAIIFLVSPYVLQESYSPNAMATALLSLLYLAIFF
jgi:hypothetical protein